MTVKTAAPYGKWVSPISSKMVADSGTGHSALPREIQIAGRTVYWIERQADESGRYAILQLDPAGELTVHTPRPYSVATKVNEYGGGAYAVQNDVIFFCNSSDQRIYRQPDKDEPHPITPEPPSPGAHRYADLQVVKDRNALLAVRERHESEQQVINELVSIRTDQVSDPLVIRSGRDFFSNPCLNPDGDLLVWLEWDLPHMPWNETELWMADFRDLQMSEPRRVAGGDRISIFQPEWDPFGRLHFISDVSGWWNLYRYDVDHVEPILLMDADFGGPQWQFGFTTYTFQSNGDIVCTYMQDGIGHIGIISQSDRTLTEIQCEYTSFLSPSIRTDSDNQIWFLGGSFRDTPHLATLNPITSTISNKASVKRFNYKHHGISIPYHFKFPSGADGDAYAFFYPPMNPDFEGVRDNLPPLVVMAHGGPTSSAATHFQLEYQFWTSRGFAIVDVNYAGSSGYGRAYRDKLKRGWGEMDVADCAAAANYLIQEGLVERDRIVIRGSSAGGTLALNALIHHHEFAAGAVYYGVIDISTMHQIFHKFEAGYLEWLIGPLQEADDRYAERSPIHHIDQLSKPVIVFQGLEDTIVPPAQSETLTVALRNAGVPHAYLAFSGEGHGFRQSSTIERALEAELYFYSQVLNIPISDSIEPVEIHNFQ